jgi:hypothetical protein
MNQAQWNAKRSSVRQDAGLIAQFRERESGFEGLKSANSLYFPVSREFRRRSLAPDCALRHSVWTVENPGCIPIRIVENPRNSATFALKPDRRKCPTLSHGKAFLPFSLKGNDSPVSSTLSSECSAITNRWFGEKRVDFTLRGVRTTCGVPLATQCQPTIRWSNFWR